jgi:hypothetical protein
MSLSLSRIPGVASGTGQLPRAGGKDATTGKHGHIICATGFAAEDGEKEEGLKHGLLTPWSI